MKVWTTTLAAALVLAIGSSALAQCKKAEGAAAGKVCNKEVAEACKAKGTDGDCPGKMLMASGAPLMEFRLGEKSTKCQYEAMKWVEKEGTIENMRFVLCDKQYTNAQEAMKAYADKLNSYLNTMTTVQYQVGDETVTCPKSAEAMANKNGNKVKFRVASYTFADETKAERAIEQAREAADKVVMKKVVDGKEVVCDPKACAEAGSGKACCKGAAASGGACCKSGKTGEVAKAGDSKTCQKSSGSEVARVSDGAAEKKTCQQSDGTEVAQVSDNTSGKKTCQKTGGAEVANAGKCEYVVGNMKTCCPDMAQVNLAQARILAAYRVLNELAAQDSPDKGTARADDVRSGT